MLARLIRDATRAFSVPGVPGIGLKAAARLIIEYGGLKTLLATGH